MQDLLDKAEGLQETLVQWRRHIHQAAEVGTELPNTALFVEQTLDSLQVPHQRLTSCGIVGIIGAGPAGILLRADMDALPGKEETGLPFASKTGAVHACGHDMHTAMLLGAAKLLKEREESLKEAVLLVFQPGEETMTGAAAMIEAGLLIRYKPRRALAMHVNVADVPPGEIWIKQDTFMAASDSFTVTVTGKGGHGAHPQNAVNPIPAALAIIEAFMQISRYEVSPMTPSMLTVCAIHAGDAGNAIPESCTFKGTLRTLNEETRQYILKRLKASSEGIGLAFRCRADFCVSAGTPETRNDPAFCSWAGERLKTLLGPDRVSRPAMVSMGSEDFAQIASRVPSCYMSLGVGRGPGCLEPLHSEKIVFDETYLHLGAAAFAYLAESYLNGTQTGG